MVGRELGELFPRRQGPLGESLLVVENLCAEPPTTDGLRLKNISFTIKAGEVFGIGGLMGAGRSELLMHIFGAWGRRTAGTVTLGGQAYNAPSPGESIRRGLVMVTEDRKKLGLVLDESIGFNLSLSSISRFVKGRLLDASQEFITNKKFFARLRIKAPDLETRVGGLSGGNQQKVVIGKALMTGPSIVFLDEPTRGIDVGAKLEVYELINELTAAGNAVILVSSELPELMGMSDRILMLGEGQAGGLFIRGQCTPDQLLAAAITAVRSSPESQGSPPPPSQPRVAQDVIS
jgi:D-xylose transport system ATP-binding protein